MHKKEIVAIFVISTLLFMLAPEISMPDFVLRWFGPLMKFEEALTTGLQQSSREEPTIYSMLIIAALGLVVLYMRNFHRK